MSEICTKCGLPKELCVCETIAKEAQEIVVSVKKVKYGKPHTFIEGIDPKQVDIKQLKKELSSKFACGGTAKGGVIELFGDHKSRIKEYLVTKGFAADTITVK